MTRFITTGLPRADYDKLNKVKGPDRTWREFVLNRPPSRKTAPWTTHGKGKTIKIEVKFENDEEFVQACELKGPVRKWPEFLRSLAEER